MHKQDVEQHKEKIRQFALCFCNLLLNRVNAHDDSKLKTPEFEIFSSINTSKPKYGSKEYTERLLDLQEALEHHYKNNSHHPEHYKNGINNMCLVDFLEMFFDWLACASVNQSHIIDSMFINKKRFNIDDQLFNIMVNTIYHIKVKVDNERN